jgi:hypothetical protein
MVFLNLLIDKPSKTFRLSNDIAFNRIRVVDFSMVDNLTVQANTRVFNLQINDYNDNHYITENLTDNQNTLVTIANYSGNFSWSPLPDGSYHYEHPVQQNTRDFRLRLYNHLGELITDAEWGSSVALLNVELF